MADIASVHEGFWDDAETWDPETIPTAADRVTVYHAVVIRTSISASEVIISASPSAGLTVEAPLEDRAITYVGANVAKWTLMGMYPDHRVIDLTGLDVTGSAVGGFSCIQSIPGFKPTGELLCRMSEGTGAVIMASPAPIAIGANVESTNNMAVSRQTSKWISAGARHGTVWITWPKGGVMQNGRRTSPEAMLDRMTRQPMRTLVQTPQWIMCGYISEVKPQESAGEGWNTVSVTIKEA